MPACTTLHRTVTRRAFAASIACVALGARAQQAQAPREGAWAPTRPIEVLISFPPGGTADALARLIGQDLQARNQWTLVALNKAGGGGVVMQRALAAARGDGHTLGLCASYQLAYTPEGFAKPVFGVDDFSYLAAIASSPMCIVARTASGIRSIDTLRAYAAKAGALSVGVSPPFSWLGDRLAEDLGIQVVSVPYKGSGELLPALLGGHIDLSLSSGGHIPHERSGTLQVVLGLGQERLAANPGVPTLRELGGQLIIESRFLLVGPRSLQGSPAAAALAQVLRDAVASAAFRERLQTALGLQAEYLDPKGVRDNLVSAVALAHRQEKRG